MDATRDKPISSITDVNTTLDGTASPPGEGGMMDRVDVMISRYSLENFQGIIIVMDQDGRIKKTNSQIHFLTNTNLLDYVPSREKEAVNGVFQEVISRHSRETSFDIHEFPLEIDQYQTTIPATIRTSRKNMVFMIKQEDLQRCLSTEIVRLKSLVGAAGNEIRGLWITNKEGIILDVAEDNLMRNLGYRKENVIGTSILSYVIPTYHAVTDIEEGTYYVKRNKADNNVVFTQVDAGIIRVDEEVKYKIYIDYYNPPR